MSAIKLLTDVCSVGEHYDLACDTTKHIKDGWQQPQICYLAWLRLRVLQEELQRCVPNLQMGRVTLIPIAIGTMTSLVAPFAKEYLKRENQNPLLTAVAQGLVQVGEGGKIICQNANTILNTACCVSYVALIAMGHTATGGIGLAGCILIMNKHKLPLEVRRAIAPLILFASAYTELGLFTNPVEWGLTLIFKVSDAIDLMKSYQATRKLLPDYLLYPNPGRHDRSCELKMTKENMKDYTQSNDKMRVNITHIYDPILSQVVPPAPPVTNEELLSLFNGLEKKYVSQFEGINSLQELATKGPEKFSAQPVETLFNESVLDKGKAAIIDFYELLGVEPFEKPTLQKLYDQAPQYNVDSILRDFAKKNLKDPDKLSAQPVETLFKEYVLDKGNETITDFFKLFKVEPFEKLTLKKLYDKVPQATVDSALRDFAKKNLKKELEELNTGFEQLKQGVVYGVFTDTPPDNLGTFREMMKAQLKSVLDDESSLFNEKFKLLALTGNDCTDGWLRHGSDLVDIPALDAHWAAAHQLALVRDDIVNRKLPKINEGFKKWGISLDIVGGVFNTHVMDGVHCSVYSYFRTYKAEYFHQIESREMLETLYILALEKIKVVWSKFEAALHMKPKTDREWRLPDYLFMAHELFHVHPVLVPFLPIFNEQVNHLDDDYNKVDLMVDTIYDAMSPEQEEVNGEIHVKSRIVWEAVTPWLTKMGKTLEDPYELVEVTTIKSKNYPHLSKEGVRAFLWDLGVIEPKA